MDLANVPSRLSFLQFHLSPEQSLYDYGDQIHIRAAQYYYTEGYATKITDGHIYILATSWDLHLFVFLQNII